MYVNHIITVFFNIYSMYFYVEVLFGVYNFTKEFSTHFDSSERLKIVTYTNDLLTHGRGAVRFFLAGQTSVTREFGSGVVLSCINDLGMTRPGIEPRSPSCEVNHLSLRHRGG